MNHDLAADIVVDCSGLLCPMPILNTTKAIQTVEIGQVLKLIATDPGSPPDMQAWSRQTGHELLSLFQEDDKYIFYFRRSK